jgi:hypothetical protein
MTGSAVALVRLNWKSLLYIENIKPSDKTNTKSIGYTREVDGLPYTAYVGGLPYYNGIVERVFSGDSCQCSVGGFGGKHRCLFAQFGGATK